MHFSYLCQYFRAQCFLRFMFHENLGYVLQVNSAGAEKLYSLAGDWAGLGPDTLLFDVCCGTGAIGLTLAKKVGMVCHSSFTFHRLLYLIDHWHH